MSEKQGDLSHGDQAMTKALERRVIFLEHLVVRCAVGLKTIREAIEELERTDPEGFAAQTEAEEQRAATFFMHRKKRLKRKGTRP